MKKVLLFSAGLIFFANLSAQVVGDYRTIASGNWDNDFIWQRFNGSAYVVATEYPGESAGTGEVIINISHAVTLNVSPAFAIGSLTLAGGNGSNSLTISNTSTLNVTGGIQFIAATTGNNTRSIVLDGGSATLNAASITMTAGTTNRTQILQFNGGGTVTLTGNFTASATPNINFITFSTGGTLNVGGDFRSEEHTSELQSQSNLVCRLLLEKKKNIKTEFRDLSRSR